MAILRDCRDLRLVALCFPIALLSAVTISYIGEARPVSGLAHLADSTGLYHDRPTPFFMPGIRMPKSLRPEAVTLPDDEDIIGVSTPQGCRAYRVAGMCRIDSHVVNDLLGATPVTVTYCDRNDCSRVFTADRLGEPLDVATGGWIGELLLRLNQRHFLQESGHTFTGEQVLRFLPHTRTTWKAWRDANPDTDIYIGPPPPGKSE